MKRWWRSLRTAVHHAVLEQARNRLALVLVIFFVPLWLTLAYQVLPDAPVRFHLRAADRLLSLDANTLTQLSGALHSITLIVGFMMFLATRRAAEFDHRLVTAGYPRTCLLLAKNAVLLLTATLAAGYATAGVCLFWRPERLDVMAAALTVGALTYGGGGILLAALLRSELAGMFVVIMVSLIDLTLQNPVANPSADSPVLRWLPAYGAMQSAVAAADTDLVPWRHLLLGLCWAAGLALAGLAVFALRTGRRAGARAATRRPHNAERTARRTPIRLRHPVRSLVYRRAGITDPAVVSSYETCRRLVRRAGRLETAITQLFPARLRPLVWAIYGYGRTLDDLSDTPQSNRQDRAARVRAYTEALEAELRLGRSNDPVRTALVDAVWRWDLPTDGLSAAAAVYHQDATGDTHLATWDDWHAYWHTLAFPFSPTHMLHLLTDPGPALTPHDAEALIRWTDVFNLIDTLRDLRQDAADGSVKLPQSVLDAYGVTLEDLRQHRPGSQFTAMIHALTRQARQWTVQTAQLGVRHPPTAAAMRTATDLQRLELRRIERNPHRLLSHRRTSTPVRFHCTLLLGRLRVARAWRRPTPDKAAALLTLPAPRPAPADRTPDPEQALLPPAAHPSGAHPPSLPAHQLPRHVAVIMDGNGRWATRRGQSRTAGHHSGQRALRDTVYGALEIGLPCLSVYALSTENWTRPAAEIDAILAIVRDGTDINTEEIWQRDVRLVWSGSPDGLPADLVAGVTRTVDATHDRTGLTLNVCFNYGGRSELTHAARALARQVARGEIDAEHITSRHLARHLHQPDLPDVDLLIRTGGEQRTSNFLPWQSAYAEFVFLDTLWPDFDRTHLWRAIDAYTRRDRRFGATHSTPHEPTA
ncbi:polyprenyl diphosphate synthase [Streptomyces sp. NPDC053427]|uniref:polyprenyl diphosphate synthase n=1 Tax=Streptomyces sp. NPDC053427 TaxID=3365701 RepID=UPI0037D1CFF1